MMGYEPNAMGLEIHQGEKLFIEGKSWGLVMEINNQCCIKIDKNKVREFIGILESCADYMGVNK